MALGGAGRAMGIDYGERRVGVALSDTLQTVATPLETIDVENSKQVFRRLRELVAEYQIAVIVVGHPLHMDGGRGDLALAAEDFAEKIRRQVPKVAVHLQDERLSSAEAERMLRHGEAKAGRRKAMRDQLAAQLILQSWLDAHNPFPED
jgi:putative Holliday junction resolvase